MEDTPSTFVDLGEDLLEHSGILPNEKTSRSPLAPGASNEASSVRSDPKPEKIAPDQVADQMESVRILLSEGMIQDAKRILRRLVLSDPSNVSARKKLEEVQEGELKRIFTDGPGPRLSGDFHRVPERAESEALMRGLDRDLGLGVFGSDPTSEADPLAASLFMGRAEMEAFGAKLDFELTTLAANDRMDIGIAFLQMGLAELATRQFRAALHDPTLLLPATALLASAHLQAGHPFEASLALQPLLADSDLSRAEKVHFAYLMGLASEALGKPDHALHYYRFVDETELAYRDVQDRIKALS